MTPDAIIKASVCPLDCPDTCSLAVTVVHDEVVQVRGSKVNPVTRGAICAKVANYYPEFVHGASRLRTPLKRVGAKGSGQFEAISWPEALSTIHEKVSVKIDRFGPQTVLPLNYAGPHGFLAGDSMSARFFHRLGASLLKRRPLCGGIRSEAYQYTYGSVPGIPLQQVALSKLIIVWGNNATACNLHLMRQINKARHAGARLVVIDPKRTRVAEQADLHLAVKPGTDVVLALSIARALDELDAIDHDFVEKHVLGYDAFREVAAQFSIADAARICGLTDTDIQQLVGWYSTLNPAVIAWGNGLERNQNGGSGIRAIAALPAIAGKFGVEGGGLVAAAGNAFPKTSERLLRPDLIPPGTRTFNILDVSTLLLDRDLAPPIDALFIYNHNPVIVHPNQNLMKQALAREDLFIVGIDIVMTDSMEYADIVLPACSHFEHNDIFAAYGQQYLQRAEPVIPPDGESLPNTEIFRRLAVAFGFGDDCFRTSDLELMNEALDGNDDRMKGHLPSELPTDLALKMTIDGEEPILFKNIFPDTASGKVELYSEILKTKYGLPLPRYRALNSDYPLTLISPSSEKRITSTFGGVKDCDATPVIEMHPDDAAERNLSNGTTVKLSNDLGEVFLPLFITDTVRPGCVYSMKGAWFKTTPNQQTVSALVPQSKADLSEGACFNDTRVEVTPAT
ncbi:MAG: molybdopterin-dependent oxidoreductase [Gammaproteobacteria bacterium]|nr:molybdopterin-dependent oxidoreductase [Gammaproteobacteria bacterium]